MSKINSKMKKNTISDFLWLNEVRVSNAEHTETI